VTDRTNRNTTEKFDLSTEALDALFARTGEHLVAAHEARQRAAEWKPNVEQTLKLLARELVVLRQRVDAVEALMAKG